MISTELGKDLQNEARTTRPHLERLPDDKFAWQPHAKSARAGALASHMVQCIAWTPRILSADAFDFDPKTFVRRTAENGADLLAFFDATVAEALAALATADDAVLDGKWSFSIQGALRFTKRRRHALRDMSLSHLIHHRGQFSVYLRLLDIAVPSSYGPTADESF
jgi:uncharacterized damage-inducible protein DinB